MSNFNICEACHEKPADLSSGGKWLCDECLAAQGETWAPIWAPFACDICKRHPDRLYKAIDGRMLCLACYSEAQLFGILDSFRCGVCQVTTTDLHTLSDGRKVCRTCYTAAQPWRVDDGTRQNYESAMNAIRGAGYEASAKMIEAYVKRLESETVRDNAES